MAARKIILSRYGPSLLSPDEVTADLRNMRLWMGYLHHRWAIDAAIKHVGGQYQNIVLKGDTLKPAEPVPAALQRSILALLMQAIQPDSSGDSRADTRQSAGFAEGTGPGRHV